MNANELKEDSDYISSLLNVDKDVLDNLEIGSINTAVSIAISWVMSEDTDDSTIESDDINTQLVCAYIEKWLSVSLIKRMLHLMTPEALVTHNQNIPPHYRNIYLRHQSHFSLTNLISGVRESLNV